MHTTPGWRKKDTTRGCKHHVIHGVQQTPQGYVAQNTLKGGFFSPHRTARWISEGETPPRGRKTSAGTKIKRLGKAAGSPVQRGFKKRVFGDPKKRRCLPQDF